MDAAAQLALMAKAKLVFETPGTFLSFPFLSPLAFHPSQLDFTQAATDTSVAAALRDFSLAVNSCPTSSIFAPVGDDYLWDRYDTWLNAMTLAGSQLSPADQAAYTAARTALVVTDSNGYDADSPKVVTYKRCRDAFFAAQQAYNAAKLTASTGDANAQATWQSTDEPRLKSAIDAANSDWNTTGYKAEVEAAQGTVSRCEAHMPEAIWAQWRHLYNPDLDRVTDPASNSSYALSGFTPGDLATQSWTPLHLSGLEIAVLKATAPLELQAIFGAVGQSDIATISFEFRSCAVVRPWFTNAVFQSRFWKFGDGSVLSDGASPANGAWPAYVSAVVFVRNVQVTYASAPAAPPQAKSATDLLRISNVQIMPHVLFNQSQPRPMPHVNFQRAAAFAPLHAVAAAPAASIAPVHVAAAAPAAPVAPHPFEAVAARPMVFARPVQQAQPAPQVQPAANSFSRLNVLVYRGGPVFGRPVTPTPTPTPASASTSPAPTPPPAPAPTPPPAPAPDPDIAVLAFICRPLPKCPDPDPALTWTS